MVSAPGVPGMKSTPGSTLAAAVATSRGGVVSGAVSVAMPEPGIEVMDVVGGRVAASVMGGTVLGGIVGLLGLLGCPVVGGAEGTVSLPPSHRFTSSLSPPFPPAPPAPEPPAQH